MRPSAPVPFLSISGVFLGAGLFLIASLFPEAGSFARAGDFSSRPSSPFAKEAAREQAGKLPDCTCRAAGVSYQLGAQICIGQQLVRCAMDLNVTSWQAIGAPCPES